MTEDASPPQRDMSKAWEGNRRKRKERLAAELRDAGWLPVPPERAEEVRTVLAAAGMML